jgi:DNA-binding NtrC family response regulator
LLRVLETGEFFKVGYSKAIKTNVRVVAATNVDITEAISQGKFREDLYYRLNTVPINVPSLRDRKEDIHLLFRKFAADFAEKYRMPVLQLDNEAIKLLINYKWNGNVRQLKNITEQISIIENRRDINAEILAKYLPVSQYRDLPVLYRSEDDKKGISERDLLYKVLFDMKKDIHDLKKVVGDILQNEDTSQDIQTKNTQIFKQFSPDFRSVDESLEDNRVHHLPHDQVVEPIEDSVIIEESLSIQEKEIDLIRKALARHHGKRKVAARELGISERTLYRKIKEYDIV